VDLLTPYKETEFHGRNFERPPPDLIDGKEEYEVEHVVDSRRFGRGCQVQYLVHWKGYPESDDQWIPWSDLNAPELLVEFQRENPDVVVHIKTGRSEETTTTVPSSLPPTSLPLTLHDFVYMSDASTTLLMSPAQTRGHHFALYEAAAAEVGDDTAGSAIIRRIMAISMAIVASGTSEAGLDVEEDDDRDEGVFADAHSGPDDDGMVLAGTNAQPTSSDAEDATGQGDTV